MRRGELSLPSPRQQSDRSDADESKRRRLRHDNVACLEDHAAALNLPVEREVLNQVSLAQVRRQHRT